MTAKSERLRVLSDAEEEALYGLPNFDDGQQLEYLALSEAELALATDRTGLHAQVHCILQIGYFKAKRAFFAFDWDEVFEDCVFVISRYFQDHAVPLLPISKHERYAQREGITALAGYQAWSSACLPWLGSKAAQLVRRDVTPSFVAMELVAALGERKIIRPGYTTLQEIVSGALTAERRRLGALLDGLLDEPLKAMLAQLLVHEDTLSDLAVLKQDAKNFGHQHMSRERDKREMLAPLHHAAKDLLPRLEISRQNLLYYASLVNYYTVFDLRRLKPGQTRLYLLCFAWLRYRQFTDNLLAAMYHLVRHYEAETKAHAQKRTLHEHAVQLRNNRKVGRLLLLYVDDQVSDSELFGTVRRRAWRIMGKDEVLAVGEHMSTKQLSSLALRWEAIDKLGVRVRLNLRPIFATVDFCGEPDNPWLQALAWINSVFACQQRLSQRPLSECPVATLPVRLRSFLLDCDDTGNPLAINDVRYEFWLYHQLTKRLRTGDIYIDDSLQHRRLADELVPLDEYAPLLAQMDADITWLHQPVGPRLEALAEELRKQWHIFNSELRRGKLPHLEFDSARQRLVWHKPKAEDSPDAPDCFYGRLPLTDIADVLRFVGGQCQFLSALTPLQPRYVKHGAEANSLLAVITAMAMNHGIRVMARTSDISHRVLENTHRQYLRLSTLQAANDCISNAIAQLPIFEHFSFDMGVLYGSVDGQKFSMERPNIQARYSRKYFGRGKGVVAYTLLCNHVPLQGWVIGAHEYEGHYAFDVWYRNTSDIKPTVVTGDMHSVNKANFAIFDWFGGAFAPRFTDANAQLKELYCVDDPAQYEKYLVKPAGRIDLQAIEEEREGIDQIVATLALKDMTQAALVRKICTYSTSNPTRRAVFEYDKLIRSIYTLRYLRDPQLQRNVHRSQNRLESYHQLRAAIAQVGGKKELTGQTDVDIEISNQCGRLVANAVIYYNAAILSRLLERFKDKPKAWAFIMSTSPVAWRHLLLGGHYTFDDQGKTIDLDALLAGLDFE
ncbi:Tn3 family transposase [Glaciimonas sp. PAMC28666]|uniref:Tn3 family transposase n=1 Tax=Glaciimonas sp. PAMC28666 TaxID=2807626 RepID=UPI00196481B0|nr:Tn3 family transposase [Glaciimonas sp. PAMC28666]QRX80824.1 Tn3 family transposase [Glaciimonas sp. PAMC28666]